MKSSKAETHAAFHKIPQLWFSAEGNLTSYSGLALIQALFATMRLKCRLRKSLAKRGGQGPAAIVQLLLLMVMLGFRRLRGLDYCREDPMLARLVGLRQLPNVATVSRSLANCDDASIAKLRANVLREPVLERLQSERLARVTVDFDGSVQSTGGHADGTAVGDNRG